MDFAIMFGGIWRSLSTPVVFFRVRRELSEAEKKTLADALNQSLAAALRGIGLGELPEEPWSRPNARAFVQKMLDGDRGCQRYFLMHCARSAPQVVARRMVKQRGWVNLFLTEYLVNHAPAHVFNSFGGAHPGAANAPVEPGSPYGQAEKLFAAISADGSMRHIADTLGGMVARNIAAGYFDAGLNGNALRMSHVLNGLGWPVPRLPGLTVQGAQDPEGRTPHYFPCVPDLVGHMKAALGKPLALRCEANVAPIDLLGRKGIIFFKHKRNDASGQVTLWRGEAGADGPCGFKPKTDILFWPLSVRVDKGAAPAATGQGGVHRDAERCAVAKKPSGFAARVPQSSQVSP